MTRSMFLALACATCLSAVPVALAHAADPPSVATRPAAATPAAQAFVDKVAVANLFEIESSRLASTKTQNAAVRSFATLMISDHGAAGTKFREAVGEAKLKMPAEKLDAAHQKIVDDLRSKDGLAFDKAYIDAQHKGHVDTVALVEAYAKDGDNARMKQFAGEVLPTLRSHLDQVTKLHTAQMGGGTSGGSVPPSGASGSAAGSGSRSDSNTR